MVVYIQYLPCRKMMEMCGDAENRLASELMQHEVIIEKEILDPLNQLAEVRTMHANFQPFIGYRTHDPNYQL